MCFNETVHDKWCLHKSVRRTENGLERGFVKHWVNSFQITGPFVLEYQDYQITTEIEMVTYQRRCCMYLALQIRSYNLYFNYPC